MSRTLDQGTLTSLETDDPSRVYKDITAVLCQPRTKLLEIELLGKSHPIPPGKNFLYEENSLAISKVTLVQAFVAARQIFSRLLRGCPDGRSDELRNATAVILLMDPEHLTAANARKRLIQAHPKGPDGDLKAVLKQELLFVNSFLTSRLHRHTKSPTLWGHRRWVLEISQSLQIENDVGAEFRHIVLVAAERHPRNYYAWSHARWMVNNFGVVDETQSAILHATQDWCLRHPYDTSGFSFLLFCLAPQDCSDNPGQEDISEDVFRNILRLAISFQWTHESVWVFLRTLAASRISRLSGTPSFEEEVAGLQAACPEDHHAQLTLKGAIEWSRKYHGN
ncbi:hypothetical protein BJ875DRAFT_283556 [Amylocarpus encephaloides]|uniref:Uncharacterized protein n=1 Tax=Amylocarpus encephaloides TaxID=45428 RepID=A0A9P7YJU2_9HELO|nr:hypothetical protein BJ875DRAFT_283556 [Amylocarpus encephaloides]